MKKKLLIIEDEMSLAKQMKWGLGERYEVSVANNGEQARQLLSAGVFPVVALDLGLPPSPDTPVEGFRLLEVIRSLSPYTKVIVITGNDEENNAIKAIGLGAVDFCPKPVDLNVLKIILDRTFNIYNLEEANRRLQELSRDNYSLCGMLSISPIMEDVFMLIRQVSETDYPVLIRGESGTGKEIAARAVHTLSHRSKAPLVAINCAAIPETLLESELFGHEKGAYTGAAARKIGRFEQANKGTIFLDEIGDMPISLQAKLLRFLQEGTIERLGGHQTIKLDTRIIAATNVNLENSVKEGRFREDLFYRLNVVPIILPPLRERPEDILLLAHHFIREESKKLRRTKVTLSQSATASLLAYTWQGNIRELQNRICRAMAFHKDGIITPKDLGLEEVSDKERPFLTIKKARDEAELQSIRHALAISGNNISHAAKILEVSRPTLHDLLKKHGLKMEE